MKKKLMCFNLVLLVLSVVLVQGCNEVSELRTANDRQAITIKDQKAEIDRLRKEVARLRQELKKVKLRG